MNNDEMKQIYNYNDNNKRTRFTVDNPNHKPFKKHDSDAGFDIKSNENVVIPANSYAIVSTCLKVAIPEGYVGILKSRSGMACKHGVETGAGVIDCSYRGYINVKLYNTSNKDYTVKIGDKITQMLIQKVNLLDWIEVDNLDETERGSNGFGSTGK